MALSENIKKSLFWINAIKIGIVFVFFLSIVSLLLNSFSDIFSGNWQAVLEQNFSNQLWKRFFSTKVIAGFVYGVYVSNKNMKLGTLYE
jgi:ABC-type Fe3+ transport system permease subunit